MSATEGIELPPAGVWTFDKPHTSLEFVARHMLSKVRGRFAEFDGTVTLAERPEDSHVEVQIFTASVRTGSRYRDDHLRSDDFFRSEIHPRMTFESTAVRPVGGNRFELVGDLTIRDVGNEVLLDATFGGFGPTPDGSSTVAFFSASAEVDREDWGLTWNMPVQTGGVLVGKRVRLEIEAEINPATSPPRSR